MRNKTQNIIYDAGGQSPYTTRKCNCGEFTKYRLFMTVNPVQWPGLEASTPVTHIKNKPVFVRPYVEKE